jgi:two-component system, NarL family, nitrate/nitrite response regulator NarL
VLSRETVQWVSAMQNSAATGARQAHDGDGTGLVRLLIVTDVPLYRAGLTHVLAECPSVTAVEAVPNVEAAAEWLDTFRPTVVLIDLSMATAVETARTLVGRAPDTHVVAFAVSERECEIVDCAEAGIIGFVPRDGSPDDVIAAVEGAARGEVRCPPHLIGSLFRHLASPAAPPDLKGTCGALSSRELEIVALIDRGLSNKEIARRLHIEVATVKNHVHHILEKLQVRRRGEAAARVRERSGASAPRPGPRFQ